ncbi:MAG: hypothetical protein GXP42_05375 [Chloroflexi bacterium]|nr:hypothetical protein [Chloroflexota bacterium]
MNKTKRPIAFWIIIVFFIFSLLMLLMGQALAVVDYELTVQLGMQESVEAISEFGVQINRGVGAADTLVQLPLILLSLVGLWRRRRWALTTTAAVMGVTAYWPVSAAFMMLFLQGAPGYAFVPPPSYWFILTVLAAFGVWGLFYLAFRGDQLVE